MYKVDSLMTGTSIPGPAITAITIMTNTSCVLFQFPLHYYGQQVPNAQDMNTFDSLMQRTGAPRLRSGWLRFWLYLLSYLAIRNYISIICKYQSKIGKQKVNIIKASSLQVCYKGWWQRRAPDPEDTLSTGEFPFLKDDIQASHIFYQWE